MAAARRYSGAGRLVGRGRPGDRRRRGARGRGPLRVRLAVAKRLQILATSDGCLTDTRLRLRALRDFLDANRNPLAARYNARSPTTPLGENDSRTDRV